MYFLFLLCFKLLVVSQNCTFPHTEATPCVLFERRNLGGFKEAAKVFYCLPNFFRHGACRSCPKDLKTDDGHLWPVYLVLVSPTLVGNKQLFNLFSSKQLLLMATKCFSFSGLISKQFFSIVVMWYKTQHLTMHQGSKTMALVTSLLKKLVSVHLFGYYSSCAF